MGKLKRLSENVDFFVMGCFDLAKDIEHCRFFRDAGLSCSLEKSSLFNQTVWHCSPLFSGLR
jgi:hypothetical protein